MNFRVVRDAFFHQHPVANDHQRRSRLPRDLASALSGAQKRTRCALHHWVG